MASLTLPSLPFGILIPSRQLLSGNRANGTAGLLTSFSSVVAKAGGGLAGSPILNSAFVELTAVATAADSVQLPKALTGLRVCITNSGVASAQIFANGTDTIQGTAGNVGVALGNGTTALYVCTKNGVWKRFISA